MEGVAALRKGRPEETRGNLKILKTPERQNPLCLKGTDNRAIEVLETGTMVSELERWGRSPSHMLKCVRSGYLVGGGGVGFPGRAHVSKCHRGTHFIKSKFHPETSLDTFLWLIG